MARFQRAGRGQSLADDRRRQPAAPRAGSRGTGPQRPCPSASSRPSSWSWSGSRSPRSCGRRRARGRSRSGTRSSSPEAVAALKLTLGASLGVSLLNAVLGTITAWVLVRDDFRGKIARQRDHRPPVRPADDRRRADAARALRPDVAGRHRRGVHADGDRPRADVRDAAVRRANGAAGAPGARPRARGGRAVARRVAGDDVPAHRLPEHPSRDPLRRRARVREGRRRVRLARDHHRATSRSRPRSRPSTSSAGSRAATRLGAAAVAVVLLAISFLDAPLDRRDPSLRDEARPMRRLALAARSAVVALAYLAVILVGPLAIVFWRTFEDGFAPPGTRSRRRRRSTRSS